MIQSSLRDGDHLFRPSARFSSHSDGLILAVGFNPRKRCKDHPVALATNEHHGIIQLSLTRQGRFYPTFRGLKPTAKVIRPLRGQDVAGLYIVEHIR